MTVRLGYLMDFWEEPFAIRILNTDKVVHHLSELDDEVIDLGLLQA